MQTAATEGPSAVPYESSLHSYKHEGDRRRHPRRVYRLLEEEGIMVGEIGNQQQNSVASRQGCLLLRYYYWEAELSAEANTIAVITMHPSLDQNPE
jgi:hypothetical protein